MYILYNVDKEGFGAEVCEENGEVISGHYEEYTANDAHQKAEALAEQYRDEFCLLDEDILYNESDADS